MKSSALRLTGALILAGLARSAGAGDLNPLPGPIGPTMKALSAVEPRTPVDTLPGDADALHVISQPGSYYLTSELIGQAGKNGIKITANVLNATIDLNGFAVTGVPGSLHGIVGEFTAPVPEYHLIEIRNGTVHLWGGDGLNLAAKNASLLRCTLEGNGGNGATLGLDAILRACIARSNSGKGIVVGANSMVIDCLVARNTGRGIEAGDCTTIRGCRVFAAGSEAIVLSNNSVLDVTEYDHHPHPLPAPAVRVTGIGNRITRNHGRLNVAGGVGLRVEAAGNHIADNTIGGTGSVNITGLQVTAAGNLIIRNSVSGVGTAGTGYDIITPGNTVGPIVNSGNIATNSNPHANYAF